MRKADKKKAEEFVEVMQRAHVAVKRTLDARNYASALDLLEQCQSYAISLGQQIEAVEGEGFVTVTFLEGYCELVYRIYEEIQQLGKADAVRVHNRLAKELIKVGNSIKNDIHVRTEAVFLPYKASMWDSLESVWRAADEDPDCSAYVIPIPYYDKNPDGSFRQKHDERDLYPKDVPITNFEEFDFAEHHPDMIFIHNPYDDCNFVTSVEPFFYAKNLKQYTDKLVYIPYFVLGEIDPDNEEALKGIEHFCITPGVLYADRVIVQSEAMRQAYINILTNSAGKHTRKLWEERILGLGSPKVDKVLNTRKEDLEVPEEWLKIIQKPDGSWKKIILYNTGLTAFLQQGEQSLRKIQDVFQIFYESREDVALLWRPHPLLKETIHSMRPQLQAEYERIVEKYVAEGWGIYDDTADLDRAIALCDAYYGDGSSVVQLCQEAGKPVMIQDVQIINDERFAAEQE